ncbi:hypothetical protein P9112_007541 [Eukaryota sp. TZLM1-RC]
MDPNNPQFQQGVQNAQQFAQNGANAVAQGGQQAWQAGSQVAQQGAAAMSQAGQQAWQAGSQVAQQGAAAFQEGGKVAAEAGKQVMENASALTDAAAQQGAQVLQSATEVAKKAQEAAAKSAPQFVGAASYVAREGGQFAAQAAAATKDIWNSNVIKNLPKPDFTAVSSMYATSRDQLMKSIAALTGAARFMFDFVKFDIFRDFGQIISLFFVSFAFGENVQKVFNFFTKVATVIALNVQSFLEMMTPLIWFYVFAITSFVMLSLMLYRIKTDPDEIRDGHENVAWEERKKMTRIMAQINLTALTSLYLSVSRNALAIILCKEEFHPNAGDLNYDVCWSDEHIPHIVVAVISLCAVTIFVPILCNRLIKRNRPQPKLFCSADGSRKEYTKKDYHEDLKKDKCPYSFLYDGYERQYSNYKVFIMCIKFALVAPIVIITPPPGKDSSIVTLLSRDALVLVILFTFATVSWMSTPFIRGVDDKIDQSARATTCLTALIGILLTLGISFISSFGDLLLGLLHTVNALLMVSFFVAGLRCCQLKWQQWTGLVHFSRKEKDWDLFRERKIRIWQQFWESLFVNDENLSACFKRIAEIKDVVSDVGFEAYRQALLPIPQQLAAERYYLESQLEGIDAYWYTEETNNGSNDSKTCFGKFWIKPFPFQCVFVYDDSDNFVFIPDHQVIPFAQVNRSPEIIRRRSVRQQLRCLNGEDCYFYHQAWKSKTVPDGTDSQGRPKSKTIRVFFTFTRGVLSIGRNRKSEWSAGFRVSLRFYDGVGSAEGHHFTRESHVVGHRELGIDHEFSANQTILRLLYHPDNAYHVQRKYAGLMQKNQEYRNGLMRERRNKEMTLSWGFWYHVFNNDRITRPELEYYLANFENNAHLKSLPQVHKAGLDFVYARLHHFNSHPAVGYWFTFWSDLWDENFAVKQIKINQEWLCPQSPNCIAYTPMPREDLEEVLERLGLMKKLRKHLDGLYHTLDVLAERPFSMY